MKSNSINHHFQTLQKQREEFFPKIQDISNEQLWVRKEGKWSIGENLYHLYLITRMLKVATKFSFVLKPYAKMRRKKPFPIEMNNVFSEYKEKKGRGMKAPFILIPPKKVIGTLHQEELIQLLSEETNTLKEVVANVEEEVAGHIIFFDPIANYPNLIQSIHLLAMHEEHHYKLIEKYYRDVMSGSD